VGHYGLDDRRFSAAARRRWRQAARRIAGTASEYAREVPRTWVEAKGYTVAVHDRAVHGRRAGLSRMARRLAALAARFGFRVVRGRRVLELVPREGGKDSAFRALLRRSRATRAVYFGDSEADIPVFTLLQKLSRRARFAALDVQVGHGPTPARYRVGGPADARRFLIALARARSSDPSPRR
jgi:trehalose-phosphatase